MVMQLNADHIARSLENELGVTLNVAVSSEAAAIDRLTAGERAQLNKLGGEARRHSWLKGRSALKSVLASLGHDEETAGICFPSPAVSLTHSGDFAIALGTTSGELIGLGVDFEVYRPVRKQAARFFLAPAEQDWVASLDQSRITRELLRLWTIKEALFKSDPRNCERWFSDYRLETPASTAGRAFVPTDESDDYRYSCLEIAQGFLSVAVLPRRHHDA